jgi:hypothetical protein
MIHKVLKICAILWAFVNATVTPFKIGRILEITIRLIEEKAVVIAYLCRPKTSNPLFMGEIIFRTVPKLQIKKSLRVLV